MAGQANVLLDVMTRAHVEPTRFFEHVLSAKFVAVDGQVTILSDIAKDAFDLDVRRPIRLILLKGYLDDDYLTHLGKWVCARGVVCKKDKEFVMISLGGLLACVASKHVAKHVSVNDEASIVWKMLESE